jgi:integrase
MKKARRMRSPHSGIVLVPRALPGGRVSWRARFRDPDTERLTFITLDSVALPTHAARRQWAIQKSRALAKRKMELSSGAPLRTRTPLAVAIDDYLAAVAQRLTQSTAISYRAAIGVFREWAKVEGISKVEELTPVSLSRFRETRIGVRKRVASPGGRHSQKKSATGPRSPFSINREIRTVKVMLGHWRRVGLLPLVDQETLRGLMKTVAAPREAPAHLSQSTCRKLLESAIRHDGETFKITRDEHDGIKPIGSTPRYEPIAPFVLFLLLSGLRISEALNLRWADIDLDALDSEGQRAGEIRLSATQTKTKRARTIGLEVCPVIRALLASTKLKSGSNIYVFGGKAALPRTRVEAARKRLLKEYGAPKFSWQNLRQTAGTFLTNAFGIFGAASVFMSARQLGHSVAVAERHYLGVIRGIPREARTLEQAMQIEDLARQTVNSASPTTVKLSDNEAETSLK